MHILIADVILIMVGLIVLGLFITRPPTLEPLNPHAGSDFSIVALGDSYISGEGARTFFPRTDDPPTNACRRSPTAYPYLLALKFRADLEFVACSGALTKHVLEHPAIPQYENSPQGVYGGKPQIEVLKEQDDPDVVLLSIGGNDAGFGDIGEQCSLGGDCRIDADYWLTDLDRDVYPALVDTYTAVRNADPEADVFVMTYPDPLGEVDCRALPLTAPEHAFLKTEFIPRLNLLIRFAADVARVRVIDLETALVGSRVCEVPVDEAAVNIVGLGRTGGAGIDVLKWAHNSFHPNAGGHEVLARVISAPIEQARDGTLSPLGPPPPPGITPPPHVPSEIGPPVGPYRFPEGTDCTGSEITRVVPVAAGENERTAPLRLVDAQPGSLVCYRSYQGSWLSTRVPASRPLELELDVSRPGIGSTNEVLYQAMHSSDWTKVVIRRVGVATSPAPGLNPKLRAGLVVGVALVFLNALALLICRRISAAD